MGTRSKIEIYENGKKNHLVTTYKQYDGYIEGLGLDIFKLLKDRQLVNGFNGSMNLENSFNGMGELAAYLIKELKQDSMAKTKHIINEFTKQNEVIKIDSTNMGNFYIQPKTKELQEYNYLITSKNDQIVFACYDWQGKQIFKNEVNQLSLEKLNEIASKN